MSGIYDNQNIVLNGILFYICHFDISHRNSSVRINQNLKKNSCIYLIFYWG
jgi:hypothetical protein